MRGIRKGEKGWGDERGWWGGKGVGECKGV